MGSPKGSGTQPPRPSGRPHGAGPQNPGAATSCPPPSAPVNRPAALQAPPHSAERAPLGNPALRVPPPRAERTPRASQASTRTPSPDHAFATLATKCDGVKCMFCDLNVCMSVSCQTVRSDAAEVGAERCGAERRIRSGAMTILRRSVASTNAIHFATKCDGVKCMSVISMSVCLYLVNGAKRCGGGRCGAMRSGAANTERSDDDLEEERGKHQRDPLRYQM